jgi:hypothetical protein
MIFKQVLSYIEIFYIHMKKKNYSKTPKVYSRLHFVFLDLQIKVSYEGKV